MKPLPVHESRLPEHRDWQTRIPGHRPEWLTVRAIDAEAAAEEAAESLYSDTGEAWSDTILVEVMVGDVVAGFMVEIDFEPAFTATRLESAS